MGPEVGPDGKLDLGNSLGVMVDLASGDMLVSADAEHSVADLSPDG